MKALKENLPRVMGIASMLVVFGWIFSFFQEGAQESFTEFCIYLTYVLVGILALGSVGLAVYHLALNRKALVKTVVIYGFTTVIFLIAYFMSTTDVTTLKSGLAYTPASLQFVGGLVGMTWGLLAIAGLASLSSEIMKSFNNG